MTVLSAIPSPPFDSVHLGPLQLRLYGLMIALGVIAAVSMTTRRWQAQGGDPDDVGTIALWAVPAGVIGARAYHVATDWKTYRADWGAALAIWNGGLGIPGGIAGGVVVGVWIARRRGVRVPEMLDAVAPALPVAQAIGRLGNWFNQEVFGRPSGLPWALRIDRENRPTRYLDAATFHPTFLYEGLWNLALAAGLIWLGRRATLRRGQLFCLYVLGYGVGRLWVEALRSDAASLVFGIRINLWVSGIAIVGAAIALRLTGRGEVAPRTSPPLSVEGHADQVDRRR
ncbi:prolipoprotein diacylglyceryl transferase [Aquihabitans sp. G128]|uniref:prolipoprotein diacylglyceryl transferase n=1 Tax=Aquihabitans sp. G128 TaxID=2849779 RepID=UPI001C2232E0|nr:prolipoprotein diacylglyceryl transferase [Aquihabitans sp. G128]QXC60630.1 prolipoprotein diacylglyceryl transferase [Aquihabitans sp. G128]